MNKQPNIVFVMLDTVRADILGTYGGPLNLSNIDSISRRSLVFENAIAPGTYTLPSHLSMFLGKRPRKIKQLMKDNIKNYGSRTDPFMRKISYVNGKDTTLASRLSYLGYNTSLFSNNPFLTPSIGITKGFSHVENIFVNDKIMEGNMTVKTILNMINSNFTRKNVVRLAVLLSYAFPGESLDRLYLRLRKKVERHYSEECGYYRIDSGARQTNRQIGRYLDSERDGSNFLFVNYMEGHEGYPTNLVTEKKFIQDKWLHMTGHNNIEDTNAERIAYMKRIEYLDGKVGELIKTLKVKGVLDNAFIIFAGDHGQSFMEHGQMYHNVFPYNEVVRVPLIISKFENGKQKNIGKRVQNAFSLTSLNKIIPEMGYGAEDGFEKAASNIVVSDHLGITEVWDTYLLKLLRNRSRSANAVYEKKLHFNRFASAVFHKDYKLIHFYGNKKDELYKINNDPGENVNLIDKNRELAHRMVQYNHLIS